MIDCSGPKPGAEQIGTKLSTFSMGSPPVWGHLHFVAYPVVELKSHIFVLKVSTPAPHGPAPFKDLSIQNTGPNGFRWYQ